MNAQQAIGVAVAAQKSAASPTVLIAASNASADEKRRATYVCTGVNDDLVFAAAIAAFPTLPQTVRSAVYVNGGKRGWIQMSEGQFNFSSTLTIPAGSVIRLSGVGLSSWRAIDPATNQYEGGTQIYCTAANGQAIAVPQYTGNRIDTGVPNTIPASGIVFEDFEVRVFNPATTQNNACLLLDGMTTGIVRNLNVLGDLSTNATPRISQGVSIQTGSRSDHKKLSGVSVYNFRDVAFNINSTHLDAEQLSGGNITGGSSPVAFQIQQDQNCRYINLHCFSAATGLKIIGSTAMDISSVMFESVTTPLTITVGSCPPINIGTVFLNQDVSWTGDITTKANVGYLASNATPALRVRNSGTATVLSGTSSIAVAHNLVAAPKSVSAVPKVTGVSGFSVTADATNITITLSGAAGADTAFFWEAKVT